MLATSDDLQHQHSCHVAGQHQQANHMLSNPHDDAGEKRLRSSLLCRTMPRMYVHSLCSSEDAAPTLMCLRSRFMPRDFANWMSDTRASSVGAV